MSAPHSSAGLPRLHLLAAVLVMAVWGSNFVIIRIALDSFPPLLLAALRYTFAFFPAALFLPRPKVAWRNLATYGVLIGGGQFGLLFIAMKGHITPGLASLVVQTQVIFTILFSLILHKERVRLFQIVALALALAGLSVILTHTDGHTSPLGIALVIGAAISWSSGNMVSRAAGQINMLSYVVWASLFAIPPLFALAFATEGADAIVSSLAHAPLSAWAAVGWQSVGNTMFGYAMWGWLLSRHPSAQVAPLALLVPVFGMLSSTLILAEPMQVWKIMAAALVMGGLILSILWPRVAQRLAR
ncbi:MAG: EamA family transporter [Alphaproteobacteria bacterium]|nr:EamA family transporter [Alphaproteobacteria bacterium]